MYSENNRRTAVRRADEEFLRRLSGGELGVSPIPHGNASPKDVPSPRRSCNGTPVPCQSDSFAPSLAMVYSPRQCWRGILDPAAGLAAGTIFSELILPLEVKGKEASLRRPM